MQASGEPFKANEGQHCSSMRSIFEDIISEGIDRNFFQKQHTEFLYCTIIGATGLFLSEMVNIESCPFKKDLAFLYKAVKFKK
jgi:hypothetical protein